MGHLFATCSINIAFCFVLIFICVVRLTRWARIDYRSSSDAFERKEQVKTSLRFRSKIECKTKMKLNLDKVRYEEYEQEMWRKMQKRKMCTKEHDKKTNLRFNFASDPFHASPFLYFDYSSVPFSDQVSSDGRSDDR